MRRLCFLLTCSLCSTASFAQTPTDLTFVPQGNICAGMYYSYGFWSEYWEGDSLRENGNVGTVGRHQILPAFNVGVYDRINVMIGLPYVITHASQGTLSGQSGLSNFYLDVKGDYGTIKAGPGNLRLGGNIGFSTPVSDYLIDFSPLNLGDGTTNLLYRQLVTYQLDNGFYAHGRAAYVYRSNINDINRDYYYNDGDSYYTGEVNVNDVMEYAFAAGYETEQFLAELSFQSYNTLGGTDIRTWEPGFPANNVDLSTINARFDYHLDKPQGLHLTASAGYAVAGRNAGQSTILNAGIFYIFRAWGKGSEEIEKP